MQYTTPGREKNRNPVTDLEKMVTKVTIFSRIGPLRRAGAKIMCFFNCNAIEKIGYKSVFLCYTGKNNLVLRGFYDDYNGTAH